MAGIQIKRDKFVINSGGFEADGTKIEPEAQPVVHVMEGAAPVGLGAGLEIAEGAGAVGAMPVSIEAHSTAQQVARSVSALCANCKNWDRAGWLKMLATAEGPGSTPAEQHGVNSIRAEILLNMPDADQHRGDDGDYDVEHAMKSMGMCHALREFYKGKDGVDPGIIGTFATAGCPAETCTPDRAAGLFRPRDAEAAKASRANYDAVMMRAAGRILNGSK